MLESDHFISVREKVNEQNQVVIIDLADANNVSRRPITPDSAIMHPSQKILALKGRSSYHNVLSQLATIHLTIRLAGRTLQIFNIEMKQKVKPHVNNEDIAFRKWVPDTTIGMVTDTSIFHWTISDPTSPPQKIFDRHATLSGAQIINYRVTPDEKRLVLIATQLYSKDRQPIEGHAAAFAEISQDGHQKPAGPVSFAVCTATGAKVRFTSLK
jgi:clathrin heavy chain